MGGLITTYAGIEGQDLFKGLIFMGPLIKMDPNIATPLKKVLAGWYVLFKFEYRIVERDFKKWNWPGKIYNFDPIKLN